MLAHIIRLAFVCSLALSRLLPPLSVLKIERIKMTVCPYYIVLGGGRSQTSSFDIATLVLISIICYVFCEKLPYTKAAAVNFTRFYEQKKTLILAIYRLIGVVEARETKTYE